MTTTSSPDAQPAQRAGHSIALVGTCLAFFAVLVGVLLPFFAPPLLKNDSFLMLFRPLFGAGALKTSLASLLKAHPLTFALLNGIASTLLSPVALSAIFGPLLILFGLFRAQERPRAELASSCWRLLGSQVVLASFAWMLWQGIQLAQTGMLSLRQGALPFIYTFSALFWGPILLAAGLALLTQPRWRSRLGFTLSAAAYVLLIALGLYLYYALIFAKAFPMRFQSPLKAEIAAVSLRLEILIPACLVLGTVLMERGKRLSFHLMMTSPLWVPFFIVFFFWSLVINTTFYFIEDLTGRSFQAGPVSRVLIFSWLCLPLFPLLLTIDFGVSLVRFFGQAAVNQLFPPDAEGGPGTLHEISPTWTYALGALLLLTVPLWILPAFLYWSARLFIIESLLQSIQGRPQTPHDRTSANTP